MIGLKYARLRSGISAKDLAKKINVHFSLISKWEAGKEKISDKRKNQLTDFFHISPDLFDKHVNDIEKEIIDQAIPLEGENNIDLIKEYNVIDNQKLLKEVMNNALIIKLIDLKRQNPDKYDMIVKICELIM